MVIAAKSGVQMLLLTIAASTVVFAQSMGPGTPQKQSNIVDARQVVLPSVLATERSWEMRDHYTYIERDEDRRLNTLGQVKSESVDVTRMMVVNGARFEQLLEHNGQLPSPIEKKRSDDDLEKLKHEGLVKIRREGTYLWYSASTEALQELLGFLYAECCTRNKAIEPQAIVRLCR